MSMLFEPDGVFHDGELAVQERDGSKDSVGRFGYRMVRPFMPDQHRDFFEMLPFVVIGMIDENGQPWATFASGKPGFIQSPDNRTLEITSNPLLAQALGIRLRDDVKIGLLGIELPTRRRNRMNGVVSGTGKDGFSVRVDQSFGNCPKYIQTRDVERTGDRTAGQPGKLVSGATISTEAKALIERVDTFFIASRTKHINDDPRSGIDVSHRGGRRGFVRVVDNNTISFPDFAGNRIFNTLGNIVDDGRVGIIFTDFASGAAALVSGRASIIWDKQRVIPKELNIGSFHAS